MCVRACMHACARACVVFFNLHVVWHCVFVCNLSHPTQFYNVARSMICLQCMKFNDVEDFLGLVTFIIISKQNPQSHRCCTLCSL